ncbi:MAG: hypothetical protein J6Z82_08040 [Schwartzia sp.]|nr:hypothetical protein [Schwartzia sp. (in: firmicutes)]
MKQWQKLLMVPLMAGAALFGAQERTAEASSFALIKYQANLTAQISKTEAWKETFITPDGKISIQIRSLLASDDKGRYHVIMWCGDTRVYEEYLPEVTYGYWFRAVRDEENDKTFFVIASRPQAKLYGYDAAAGKMQVYVDSKNFHSGVPSSEANITPLNGGSLVLSFENFSGVEPQSHRYELEWDPEAGWITYTDLGTGYQPVMRDMQYQ